jgi:cold shock protein
LWGSDAHLFFEKDSLKVEATKALREIGKVKWFRADLAYGFITRRNGEEAFFHFSALEMDGYKTVERDRSVEYEIEESPKGVRAVKVVPL